MYLREEDCFVFVLDLTWLIISRQISLGFVGDGEDNHFITLLIKLIEALLEN
jgi:hypothetical protein